MELNKNAVYLCTHVKHNCKECKLKACCFGYFDSEHDKILSINKAANRIMHDMYQQNYKIER